MIHITELEDNQYDLSPLAQRIITKYYLNPFPQNSSLKDTEIDPKHFEITDSRIPRCTHGAMHASRVAAYVKIIHLFRQDQHDPVIPALADVTRAYNLTTTQLINLTQIAALFHDVSRENEGVDHWDEESANECSSFLKTEINSLPDSIIQLIANTISFKDNEESFLNAAMSLGLTNEQARAADYLRQLVHDADCLDIMRVRKTFKNAIFRYA